jgi:hypothetical protein
MLERYIETCGYYNCCFGDLLEINMLPIDIDILSMEIPLSIINKFTTDDDISIPFQIAKIIEHYSISSYGIPSQISGFGLCASRVANLLQKCSAF